MPNINKLGFVEAFNNDNGKTSGNKLIGITTAFVCLIIFIACTIYFFIVPENGDMVLEFIDKDLYFYITGCGTMGIKTISSSFGGAGKKKKKQISNEESETEIEYVQD